MKLMSWYVNGNTQAIFSVNTADEANELNQFFNHFDCHDFSRKHSQIHDVLKGATDDDFQRLHTSEDKVTSEDEVTSGDEARRAFQRVNTNKASGPDNMAPRVLKTCAEQLAHIVLHYI